MQSMASIRRHQMLSLLPSLSLSLWLSHSTAIAYTPSYWPSSISQPVNHMNRFRLRFVFDSNQFVWHFWLFHPLPHHCNCDLRVGCFRNAFCLPLFLLLLFLVCSIDFVLRFQSSSRKTEQGKHFHRIALLVAFLNTV